MMAMIDDATAMINEKIAIFVAIECFFSLSRKFAKTDAM